jgi:hypothetical protein
LGGGRGLHSVSQRVSQAEITGKIGAYMLYRRIDVDGVSR